MSESEYGNMVDLTNLDLATVSDLNMMEGDTIALDYQDLYDLPALDSAKDSAPHSYGQLFNEQDMIGTGDHDEYHNMVGYTAPISVKDDDTSVDVNTAWKEYSDLSKEYTDLSKKIVLENSIESIRNVIEVTDIPPINRHIIERSIDRLQSAIDISENCRSEVNDVFGTTSSSLDKDYIPHFVRTGFPLTSLPGSEEEKQPSGTKTKVSPLSVDEERVREALGMSSKITTDDSLLYNPSFSKDRERNIQVIHEDSTKV